MIRRHISGAKRKVPIEPETQTSAVSPNPYSSILRLVTEEYGEPAYELTLPGTPRGFTVARKCERKPHVMKAYLWAQEFRAMLGHVYGIEHLSASAEAPLFFWSEAWFGSGRHCDPENTHKLCKDALFYLCPGPKDKHTGGAFAGPLYDLTNPRTEVRVWRLTVSSPIVVPKRVARKPDPVVEVEPTRTSIPTRKVVVPATKVANPFDMLKGRK